MTHDLPRVSVIIPVYNGANYLADAIDSALAQTYGNFEVIVVNDGSDDGGATASICRGYGDRIRYFEKENGGVATALNLGIEEMTGEYFSWLSHDDLYRPNKLEVQVEHARGAPGEKIIWLADYDLIDGDGKHIVTHRCNHDGIAGRSYYYVIRGEVNGCTVLIPRAAFEEHGLFDPALRYTQDYDLWARMSRTYEFRFIPDVLTVTRLHAKRGSNDPEATEAGDILWGRLAEVPTALEKAEYEGNAVKFHNAMADFLSTTPYKQACRGQFMRALELHRETLASVIIPFRDRIDLTRRAIASVMAQSHSNIEIIVVDDGSQEDVGPVQRLAAADPRIVYVRQDPRGVSAARNRGLELSRGAYVAFLDSDDYYLPTKIATQMWRMQNAGAMICHTSYYRLFPGLHPETKLVRTSGQAGMVWPRYLFNCQLDPTTTMVDRRIIDAGLLQFDEALDTAEDVIAWYPVLRQHQLLAVEEGLSVSTAHAGSAAYDIDRHVKGLRAILDFASRNLDEDLYGDEFTQFRQTIGELEKMRSQGMTSLLFQPDANPAEMLGPEGPPSVRNHPGTRVSEAPWEAAERIAELEALVVGMRSSTSWRITGPLRRVKRLVRGR